MVIACQITCYPASLTYGEKHVERLKIFANFSKQISKVSMYLKYL